MKCTILRIEAPGGQGKQENSWWDSLPLSLQMGKNREVLPPGLILNWDGCRLTRKLIFLTCGAGFLFFEWPNKFLTLVQKRSSGSLGDGVQITIRLASPGWEVGESQLRGMGAQRREAHGVEQEGGCGAHQASFRTGSRRGRRELLQTPGTPAPVRP